MDVPVNKTDMMQRIETSLISAHVANFIHTTDLAEISCKPYEPGVVADFVRKYSGVSEVTTQVSLRC
jgi:hypothetical protein